MNNIFIISSPLQLVNAIEAKNFFQLNNSILVIIYSSNKLSNTQIDNILEKWNVWDKIIKFKRYSVGLNFPIHLIKIKKLLRQKYNYTFIGDYSPAIPRIFAQNVISNNNFLIDDGVATINIVKDYISNGIYKNYVYSKLTDPIRILLTKLLLLKTKFSTPLHLFSCFNVPPHKNQLLVKNEYHFLKTILNSSNIKTDDENVYFLGAKYVEQKIMNVNTYIDKLLKVKEFYKDKNFIYVAHRGEKDGKLTFLKNNYNINYVRFNNIVEIEFILKNVYPMHIGGFASSALMSIKSIYKKTSITSFKIPDNLILKQTYRNDFKNIYQNFFESNIKIIEI